MRVKSLPTTILLISSVARTQDVDATGRILRMPRRPEITSLGKRIACGLIIGAAIVLGACDTPAMLTHPTPTTTVGCQSTFHAGQSSQIAADIGKSKSKIDCQPTATAEQLQTDLNANKQALTFALMIMQAGPERLYAQGQSFLDNNGNIIPSHTAKSGSGVDVTITNAVYAGQLVNTDLQSVELFATVDVTGKSLIFIEVQFYSPSRDDATLAKLQTKDRFSIKTQDIQLRWEFNHYDPRVRQGDGGTLWIPIGEANAKFTQGWAYNLDLSVSTYYDYSQPNAQIPSGQDQLTESYAALYNGGLVNDSMPESAKSVEVLLNGGSVDGTALLTKDQLLQIMQETNSGSLPSIMGIAPAIIMAGN